MLSADERRISLLKYYKANRAQAHHDLFPHRHKDEDSVFVDDLLELLYSAHPLVALMAFRGAAKSTYMEEYVILSVLFREAVFPLIISYKEEMAAEHLAPIRNELETNDLLIELFGDQKATPWSQTELGLANGAKIQAIGAGQSMRGKKHNDERPDMACIDDLEDEDSILTDVQRHKTDRWLMGTLMPALHPKTRRVRFIGTALHPKSLIVKKCEDPRWKSRIFPLVIIDKETGEEKSAWPSRFPMEHIRQLRDDYINAGNMVEFQQEFMCRAEDIAGKPFQPGMIKVEPVPATYSAICTMTDPARTTKEKSARTGYAAWSWIGNRLIVHKAEGHFHKPDEIIAKQFEWKQKFNPVHMGVEAVGLEEFLMQPLRAACVQRGVSLPVIDMRAPKDKISFIKGLQPFYIAGDVIHVEHHPDLEQELIQFPTGRMDVVNALAYALRMRIGRPVYDDFSVSHIAPVLEVNQYQPKLLILSSRQSMTAAVLCQHTGDILKVFRDWMIDAPPQECFPQLFQQALVEAGGGVRLYAPLEQFDTYLNTGLPAAIKAENLAVTHTVSTKASEGALRDILRDQRHGSPAFLVRSDAHWVVNGLAMGYARKLDKHGQLEDLPQDNQYRVVIEGLESFIAWMRQSAMIGQADGLRVAHTKNGRSYYSLRAE